MGTANDAITAGKLVRSFIAYSLVHGGADVVVEAERVARLLDKLQGASLGQLLREQIPDFTTDARDPIRVIQQALAGGALIARHLFNQCGDDADRAQSLIFLFAQDWTRLFAGAAMKRQWVKGGGPVQ